MPEENLAVAIARLEANVSSLNKKFDEYNSTLATKEQLARATDNVKYLDDAIKDLKTDIKALKGYLVTLAISLLLSGVGFVVWYIQQDINSLRK